MAINSRSSGDPSKRLREKLDEKPHQKAANDIHRQRPVRESHAESSRHPNADKISRNRSDRST